LFLTRNSQITMTGYTVHAGSNQKFAAGWDQVFSQGAAGSGTVQQATTSAARSTAGAHSTAAAKKKAKVKQGAGRSRAAEQPSAAAATPAARATSGGSKTRKK